MAVLIASTSLGVLFGQRMMHLRDIDRWRTGWPHLDVDYSPHSRYEAAKRELQQDAYWPEEEQVVIEHLPNLDGEERLAALRLLTKHQPMSNEAFDAFASVINDPSYQIRDLAIGRVTTQPDKAKPLVPAVDEAFNQAVDQHYNDKTVIVHALLKLDPGIRQWRRAMQHVLKPLIPKPFYYPMEVKLQAELKAKLQEALASDPKLLDDYSDTLTDEDPDVRAAGLILMTSLGEAAEGALPRMTPLLDDPAASVRRHAPLALVAVGAPDEAAQAKIAELMQDEDVGVRMMAACAVWKLTQEPTEVDRVLARALADLQIHTGTPDADYDADWEYYMTVVFDTLAQIGPQLTYTKPLLAAPEGRFGKPQHYSQAYINAKQRLNKEK